MNKVSKTLMLMLPLLAVLFTAGEALQVQAEEPGHSKLSPKSFGDKTGVCGDRLCSEVDDSIKFKGIEIVDTYPLTGNYFLVIIKAESAEIPVFREQIHVSSDMEEKKLMVPFIYANSETYVTTTIHAVEESSIVAAIPSKDVASEPKTLGPTVELVSIDSISEQDNIYRIIFDVTADEFNFAEITVRVSSDYESKVVPIGGVFKGNTQTNQVTLIVNDPASVSIELIDFKLNR